MMDGTVRLPSAVRRAKLALENPTPEHNPVEVVETNDDTLQPEVAPITAAPAPVAVTPPEKTAEETAKYWEHRFKTLQGMENAEKTRLKEQLAGQNERLRALEDQLVQTEKRIPKEFDLRQYLSEDELETLDAGQLKAAIKVAVGASSEEIAQQVRRQVEPLQQELQRVNQNTLQARKDAFFMALESAVPEWRVINDDPAFHQWLSDEDPISGVIRQTALTEAETNLDARRVVKIFNTFQKAIAPQPVAPSKLTRQVQPDTVAGQPTSRDSESPAFTKEFVKNFYKEVMQGRWRGRDKERQALERKIELAQYNGTIR